MLSKPTEFYMIEMQQFLSTARECQNDLSALKSGGKNQRPTVTTVYQTEVQIAMRERRLRKLRKMTILVFR